MQSTDLLKKLASLVGEPIVRDKIISGTCAGVDTFINSLGPMGERVRVFLPLTTVERKIREYLFG